MPIQTLTELFLVAAGHDKAALLMHKVDGKYVSISTRQFVADVHRLTKALGGLGVERGDRVALMAENGPSWPLIDFASLCAGAALVPIYPTLLPEQAAYVANDSGAKVLFVQGAQRLESLLALRSEMPLVKRFVVIGAPGMKDAPTLESVLATGDGATADEFESQARMARPDDLATLIYTSGTTGNPKGVMLTHGNIASNIEAGIRNLEIKGEYTALSFLPLAHSFERTVDYIYFYKGCTIAYAESVMTVAQNLSEVRPQVFVSVPRVYEKVLAKVQENVAKGSGLKQKIFAWANGVGRRALPWRLKRESPPGFLGLKLKLADKLVFAKIRERLGGRFEFAVSGGAPLGRDVAEFFWGAGVPIYEGYGLTETSPVLTVGARRAVKLGTVGRAVDGVTLRIAADGEILAKGPNIMKGYYNNPTATAEVIDSEGWFHTGDIGNIDSEGFLAITDRKKEILVNAYGKNIAPAPIENSLKASRWIAQAVVIGDQRQFLSALIVPDFEALRAWGSKNGASGDDASLIADPRVHAMIKTDVEGVNKSLARYEQVRTFELLPKEFTLETGELTPTQKVKRRVVTQKYAEAIDKMYRDNDAG
ncbi:MAG: long-chain fatty acid--CoA ligase [Acidobacteriota bacterium]